MIGFLDKVIQTILLFLIILVLLNVYSLILIRLYCSNINVICAKS